jgi:hypothetical protein
MIIKNKKMTSKTTKTVMFVGLIMTLMIPVTGITNVYAIKPQIDCDDQIQIAIQNATDVSEKQYKEKSGVSEVNSEIKYAKEYAGKIYDFQGITIGGTIDPENCTVHPTSITASFNSKTDDKHVLVELLDADLNHIDIILKENRHIHAQQHLKNWSGKVVWQNTESTSIINEARTTTTAPDVSAPTGAYAPTCGTGSNACVASTWTGVSRDWNGYDLMFQGGVDTECISGCTTAANSPVYGWWEVIDNGSHIAGVDCTKAQLPNLYEGDAITVTTEFKPANSRYYFTLQDIVSNNFCGANFASTVQPRYAQYIVERVWDPQTSAYVNIPKFTAITHQGYYKDGTGTRYGINVAEAASKIHSVTMTHNALPTGTVNVNVGLINDSTHQFTATWYSSRAATP